MEIDINDYLSKEQIGEIVVDELRRIIRNKFNSDKEIERLIGNSAYEKAFGILDNSLPEGWVETVTAKVEEVVNDVARYSVFRYNWSSNMPESVASKLIEQVVIDNKLKIIDKVNEIIDDRLNKDSENKDRFVDNLIDSFYNTFTVKFERGDK